MAAAAPQLGEFELLVLLSTMSLGDEAYPVSIAADIEARTGRKASRTAVLVTLERLEDKGFVRWKLEAGGPERQHLPKRTYVVLPRGIAALRTSQRVLRRMWRGPEHILKEPS